VTVERPVILVLSGPNLQLFGIREPEIYGTETLEERIERARQTATDAGAELEHVQSDSEAALVAAVHEARGRTDALIVNAGALSHYGWSLHDALAAFDGVVVELHVSNPSAREAWRHRSVVAPVADGLIAGLGGDGYELAVDAALRLVQRRRSET
jgi:3-dehydroquinate dehydratase-2